LPALTPELELTQAPPWSIMLPLPSAAMQWPLVSVPVTVPKTVVLPDLVPVRHAPPWSIKLPLPSMPMQ